MPIAANVEYIKIPELNPFRWIKEENGTDNFFANSIPALEETRLYEVPMQQGDNFNAQIQVKTFYLTSVKMELIDKYGAVKQTASITSLYVDASTGYTYINFEMVLGAYTGQLFGLITVTLTDASVETYISEPMCLQATQEDCIVIDYSHDQNEYDMIFQPSVIGLSSLAALNYTPNMNIRYRLRIEGGLWTSDRQTGSNDVIYFNEVYDPTIIHSVPFELFTWKFGAPSGLPNWVIVKLQRIFSCAYTAIDGTYYVKNDGANLEISGEQRSPMQTASLQMLYAENNYSKIYSKTILSNRLNPTGIGTLIVGNTLIVS